MALHEKADCLTDLGRYVEAATAYEEAIRHAKEFRDLRQVAVSTGQLATLRLFQGRHKDALDLNTEARITFHQLGEPASVATAWHQIARVYEEAANFEAAETAYQESLKIKVQIGNRAAR